MKNFFESSDRGPLLDRLDKLQRSALRQWGKMDVAQMCAHCAAAAEVAAGDVRKRQAVLRSDQPLSKNSPTDPTFVVSDPRDFEKEKARLIEVTSRFCAGGPGAADGRIHSFFGRMTGDEWGVLMYKHLDHHLRQFGA